MAEAFNPPAADLPGKPFVEQWVPPSTTKLDIDWAQLRTIELSLLDSPDPKVVQNLVDTCRAAIRDDGFIFLTDYGVSYDQVSRADRRRIPHVECANSCQLHRQFSIAQYLHRNMSEEDKERLHWNPDESGTFAGWKPRFGWRVSQLGTVVAFELRAHRHHSETRAPRTASNTTTTTSPNSSRWTKCRPACTRSGTRSSRSATTSPTR